MEGTSTLSVKTHDLGKGLSDDHLESLAHEVSEACTVLIEVTSNESLVGSVEVWEQTSLLAYSSDLLPLIKSWVDASWIMSASVEHNG